MAQYAVMIFERETPGGAADIPPEVMEAHGAMPGRVAEAGGRILGGLALEQTGTATTIRDGVITDGPSSRARRRLPGSS